MIVTILAQHDPSSAPLPGPGLLFGLLLVAAIVGGFVAHKLRVPRVVGYLVAGGVLKLVLCWLFEIDPLGRSDSGLGDAALPLKAITDLGLGFILFSIGAVFEVRHLRSVGRKVLRIALGESGLTFTLVLVGTLGAGLIVSGGTSIVTVLAFALLLAFAAIATAPAATLSVLREYDAKGPATGTILSLTGLNNVLCIVAFHLCFSLLAAAGVLGEVSLSSSGIWIDLLTTTLGSVVFGVVLGFGLSLLHAKLQPGDTLLVLVAVLIVVGAGEGWLHEHHYVSYNFMLTAICAGATFANVAIDPDRLEAPLRLMSRPILVGFFAIAGYKLHLAGLADLQIIGVTYIVCRAAGKIIGSYVGIRWSGASADLDRFLGSALLCQAAVVIGLAEFVGAYWDDDWARRFVTVALGSVVVFELSGPLLTKWVVKQAGEVKVVTLLRRTGAQGIGSGAAVRLVWQALLRTLGLGRIMQWRRDAPLLVRDVMRATVKSIPADAGFDDVLHFVEQSRFNHFPVVDARHGLVGVIHFSDIREIIYDPHLSNLITAVDLASPASKAVPANMSIDDVMNVFKDGDVGSLPVVDTEGSRNVVGIVEQRDVLRAVHLSRRTPNTR